VYILESILVEAVNFETCFCVNTTCLLYLYSWRNRPPEQLKRLGLEAIDLSKVVLIFYTMEAARGWIRCDIDSSAEGWGMGR